MVMIGPEFCYVIVPGAAPGKRIGIVKRGPDQLRLAESLKQDYQRFCRGHERADRCQCSNADDRGCCGVFKSRIIC